MRTIYIYSQHKDLIINKQQQKTNEKFVYFYAKIITQFCILLKILITFIKLTLKFVMIF